ncbi:hypothetical protein ASZ90_016881 [hydrocarbon metagenome]|uniref:Uncharacterized protein n=1 Tax=hydrocarbon metagenome TaxID=938273 RepID=A0A0W8EB57_9ZZZZ
MACYGNFQGNQDHPGSLNLQVHSLNRVHPLNIYLLDWRI